MDLKPKHSLSDIITLLDKQNIRLGQARNAYLGMKAQKDHVEATLIKASGGESNAEKVVAAKATNEWLAFHSALNRAEAEYEYLKQQMKILELEYQSQYLELKLNEGAIKRG